MGAMSAAHNAKEEHYSHLDDNPFDTFCGYCQMTKKIAKINGTTHLVREYGFEEYKSVCKEEKEDREDFEIVQSADIRTASLKEKVDCKKCREKLELGNNSSTLGDSK